MKTSPSPLAGVARLALSIVLGSAIGCGGAPPDDPAPTPSRSSSPETADVDGAAPAPAAEDDDCVQPVTPPGTAGITGGGEPHGTTKASLQ